MQRLKEGEAAEDEPTVAEDLVVRAQDAAPARGRRVEVRHPRRGRRGRPAAPGQVLPAGVGRRDRRLRLARPRHHDPPRGLPERRRAAQGPRALRPGQLGRRLGQLVQGRAAGRRLGSPPAARGPLAHVRRGRHQHRRGALHRHAPDGQEPLRGRGRGHPHAQGDDHAAALDRRGLRRLPRHARPGAELRASAWAAGRMARPAHPALRGAGAALLRLRGGPAAPLRRREAAGRRRSR